MTPALQRSSWPTLTFWVTGETWSLWGSLWIDTCQAWAMWPWPARALSSHPCREQLRTVAVVASQYGMGQGRGHPGGSWKLPWGQTCCPAGP